MPMHDAPTATSTRPALLPSLLPPPSISPAKRDRTASSTMYGVQSGSRLQSSVAAGAGAGAGPCGAPRTGLSPRKVDANAWLSAQHATRALKGVAPAASNIKRGRGAAATSSKESRLGLAKACGTTSTTTTTTTSAASRLASLHARPNTHPPADVFFTPPPVPEQVNPTIAKGEPEQRGADSPRALKPASASVAVEKAAAASRSRPGADGNTLKRQRAEDPSASASERDHLLANPIIANIPASKRQRHDESIAGAAVERVERVRVANAIAAAPASVKRTRTVAQGAKAKEKESERVTEWRTKYTEAFPKFVFYLNADIPHAMVGRFLERIKKLGGRSEHFLSSRVTHHITVRGQTSVQKKASPIKGELNVFVDAGPAVKSPELNVKVWSIDKLNEILVGLLGLPKQSPARTGAANQSLRTLLEDERLHGTRERDSTARRADYYYFAPGNCYLLVEDATGEHRPIMVKEYERPRQKDEAPGWPVLHETFLKPSKESLVSKTSLVDLRAQAWKTYVERAPEASSRPIIPLRSVAVAALNKQLDTAAKKESLVPYQAASGNSVVLTSTIASTSNAHLSGGTASGSNVFGGERGGAAYAQGRDKRLVNMSKRVQVLKGNFMKNASGRKAVSQIPTVVSPVKRALTAEQELFKHDVEMYDAKQDVEVDDEEAPAEELDEEAADVADYEIEDQVVASQTRATEMYKKARDRVVQMLQEAKEQTVWSRPAEIQMIWDYCKRTHKRVQRDRQVFPIAPKPGYCENCRVKFEDVDVHIHSRRHKKFATNAANFAELDQVLARLVRAPAPPSREASDEIDYSLH